MSERVVIAALLVRAVQKQEAHLVYIYPPTRVPWDAVTPTKGKAIQYAKAGSRNQNRFPTVFDSHWAPSVPRRGLARHLRLIRLSITGTSSARFSSVMCIPGGGLENTLRFVVDV
jgi:hypothetical protein